jgi:hypothetical protein
MEAQTQIGRYRKIEGGISFNPGPNQWLSGVDGIPATEQDAEADYIARCSEFLRVAGPGECVVDEDDLARCVNMAVTCPDPDQYVIDRLTAAIDAARKENEE